MLAKLLFLVALVALFAWFLHRRSRKRAREQEIEADEWEGPPKRTHLLRASPADPDPCVLVPRNAPPRHRPPLVGVTQIVPKPKADPDDLYAWDRARNPEYNEPFRIPRSEPAIAPTPVHLTFTDDSDRHRHHDTSPTYSAPDPTPSSDPAPDDFKGGGGDFGGGASGSWD